MKKEYNPNKYLIIITIFFCLILCFLHIILFKINLFAISADESGRTLDAYQWSIDQTRLSDVWLPFQAIETGLMIKIWKDLFIVPRIICIFWGMCTLAAISLYSFELFQNIKISILSLLIASFFPPLLVLTHVPLPEITFIFFVLLGMFFYLRWQKSGYTFPLICSAFCFALSSSIRYEGWVFVFIFTAQLVWMLIQYNYISKSKNIALILAGIVSLSFSIYWIIQTTLTTESPISFIGKTSSAFSQATHASFLRLLWLNLGTQFLVQCVLSLNILGIVSAVTYWKYHLRIRHMLSITISALICMALMSFLGRTLPTHNPWRTAVIWNCLLIPFTANWLTNFFHRKRIGQNYSRYALISLILFGFCLQMFHLIKQSSFSSSDYSAGKYLELRFTQDISHTEKILIETTSWDYLHVIIASNRPELFIYNSGYNPRYPSKSIIPLLSSENIPSLEEMHVRFLVFRSPEYKSVIEKKKNLIKRGEYHDWVIYERVG
jgi:hypothetical protein